MAQVILKELRKVFPDQTIAVKNLDLTIKDQEFLTLLGPSGCGKTTTLRMIAGLESPTSGEIYFDEQLVNNITPAKRNIAMVFQTYALYPHLTVRGNLEYPMKKRKVPTAERSKLVSETATLLQIEKLLDRKPRQLSGGQQQRLALVRAMIRDPLVFLLDEPLSNLDATLRAYMRAELIQLRERIGKTMIYVTHDQLEAMTMSDRIAILNEGNLQQLGTPDEVYNTPINKFVAGFVGTPAMNFFDGELVQTMDNLNFQSSSLSIPLGENAKGKLSNLSTNKKLIAGIRPEDILVGIGSVKAKVTVVEPAGYETLVFLKVDNHSIVARVSAEATPKSGTSTTIGFRESKMHLFDSDNEMRIE
jgi:multiple sugar transport system ATP-binding protein